MQKKQVLARVTIAIEHDGYELAIYLKEILNISNRQLQKIVRTRGLLLNGRVAHSKRKLRTGDQVKVLLPRAEQVKIPISEHDLVILYEDSWLLGVEKPPGLDTYATKTDGLANRVAGYYLDQGLQLTPRPLHRLDKPTSGVVVFGKDANTQTLVTQLWNQEKVERFYWAICEGQITEPLLINTPLNKRKALTKVEPLKIHQDYTELRVQLITGRTHQIRRHLAEINHPLLGDDRYGKAMKNKGRLALHSTCVQFPHPHQNNQIVAINSPIPFTEFPFLK